MTADAAMRQKKWRTDALINACFKVTDGSHFSPIPQRYGKPIANVKDLRSGKVDIDSCTKISDRDFQALARGGCEIKRNDVLLSKDGTIGKVLVYTQKEELVALSSIAILRPSVDLNPFFLAHILESDNVARQIGIFTSGSALRRLVLRDISRIIVPLPDPTEQEAIAIVCDAADEAIAKTENLIDKLKLIKLGLLRDLLTRGLDQNGELRDPVNHPEQFESSQLGIVPRAWDVVQLGTLSEFVTSGSRGWASYYANQGALFIRMSDLTREHIHMRFDDLKHVQLPFHAKEGRRTGVQEGDVLISITADLGIIGVCPDGLGEAYVNQHLALVRLKADEANSDWVANYLAFGPSRRQFHRLNDQGAKAGMNLPTVQRLLIAKPSKTEQEWISNIINSADRGIDAEKSKCSKLIDIKKGLMQDLLTGRVRINSKLQKFRGEIDAFQGRNKKRKDPY